MTEPDPPQIDPLLLSLYAAERDYEEVAPADVRARVWASVGGGPAGPGGGQGGSPDGGAVATIPLRHAIGGMVATSLIGALVGAGVVTGLAPTSERRAAPATSISVQPASLASSAPSLPSSPTPAPSALPSSRAPSRAPTAEPILDARALAAERALVDVARAALARGEPEQALDAVARHEREYPDGRHAEEREAIAVRALARAGRVDEAKRRGARFFTTYPNSLAGPAVKAALESAK